MPPREVGALRNLLECLGLALVYALVAQLSLRLAFVHPNATAVWPPSGIAMAALLLGGLRLWPGILLGSFLGNVLTSVPVWAAGLISLGNTAEAVLGAWLVGRFAGGAEPFHRVRDTARFIVFGGLLAPLAAASVGTAALVASDAQSGVDAGAVWLTWWLGDATGCIVVAPLLLLWLRATPPAPSRPGEGTFLVALVLALGALVFGGAIPPDIPVDYLVLPPLLWAAFRLSLRQATTVTVVLMVLAVFGTIRGHGPFQTPDPNEALLIVQGFLATIQLTTLLVGALLAERRQALEDLTRGRDALEVRVRERTEELLRAVHSLQEQISARDRTQKALADTQERLRQFEKMEAVGRLAGGVAHDFNNMLTAILMHADQLLLDLPSSRTEWRQAVVEIREAGRRSAALTSQLLAFSRKHVTRSSSVRLAEVVASLHDMVQRLIGAHIRIEVDIPADLPPLRADRGQMEQILVNLAVNARDAMPEGGVIRLSARSVSMPRSVEPAGQDTVASAAVCLEFADTGCGMEEEVARHLFEPFFTTKTRGTGLGLSTVYGIVRQNDGLVEVHTRLGQGTTFRLHFPVGPIPEALESPRRLLPGARGHETILLVEDEPVVRGVVRRVLESAGYTVVEGCDGQEGLELGERFPGTIDLLLSDVVMPRLGGGELARRLREIRPGMPVVFMSGYSPDSLVQHGLDQASAEFLQKPFSPRVLVEMVREVLDREPAEAQPDPSRTPGGEPLQEGGGPSRMPKAEPV